MALLDEYETSVRARVRTGRHGPNAVQWGEPFVCGLYLQKTSAGQVCGLALQDVDFAEFDPRREAESERVFVTEDYLLEILDIPVRIQHRYGVREALDPLCAWIAYRWRATIVQQPALAA
jgi:hypothetical protein